MQQQIKESLTYFNRENSVIEKETVYGEGMIKWLYETRSGNIFSHLLCKAPISKIYGSLQDSPLSKRKIKNFIEKFQIKMHEYLPQEGRSEDDPYTSFNQFFIRRFKPGARDFVLQKDLLPAVAEGRYLGYQSMGEGQVCPVKGIGLSQKEILQKGEWAETFKNGPVVVARLCPVDYHRFHFPDGGKMIDEYHVDGNLHSVNPVALKFKSDIFYSNDRHISILETDNFGKIAYIEVGAMCVGKIIQSYDCKRNFLRGEEKGYFLFGGSTVILMGEKGAWIPDADILKNTGEDIETYIKLGRPFAHK